MALEYESNPNLVGAIKAPLGVLGADKNYRQALYETVAEQVEGLGRRPNSDYTAGDVVTSSTNNQLQLLCTTSGTTSSDDLDISTNQIGDSITDGTVVWACFSRMQAGVPVGFEYFTTNPNIPAGSLPLFGGEYSREVYKDLWEWVQTQAGYLLEESEWQAKSSANDGNVPFYSKGDGNTTFRVPSLKCWVKGANGIEEVGSYLSAGLPNIYGWMHGDTFNADGTPASIHWDSYGALSTGMIDMGSSIASHRGGASYSKASDVVFNASKSNPIYGNSDTVQPKSIVGMWLVKAYGTVTNVGSTDVAAIAQGLTRVETRVTPIANGGTGATTASQACANIGALSTSGGTITGEIKRDGNAIVNTGTFGSTNFSGGTGLTDGAILILRGKDQTNIEGMFQLVAQNGTASATLQGTPAGQLTWNGQEILHAGKIIDYIVGSYRNGTSWYEVYKSGKVRQGGTVYVDNSGTNKNFTVSLIVPFANTNYFAITIVEGGDAGTSSYQFATRIMNKTTSYFQPQAYNDEPFVCAWYAEGQGA